mmetsp:Transcript_5012/g.9623  ORF Transcript_5012/g.9623 Transcript_5012/m.9623 type:complete len:368 (+) Transcript_5012:80-1183(+)
MRVLAVVLACSACTGHGRRVLMASQGPSGFQDVGDGHVSGHARRVNSGIDDVRGVQVRRGRSGRDDFGDVHMPRGNSGFGDMRGGHERMGRSERDDFKFGHGRNMGGGYERRGTSEPDDLKYGHRRDLRDVPARRGQSGFDDMRGGLQRRGRSEFDDDFKFGHGRRSHISHDSSELDDSRFGRGRRGHMPSQGPSGFHVSGPAHSGFDDMRDEYERRGTSEFDDDFKFGLGRRGRMTSQERSGLHERRGNSGYDEMRGGYGRRGTSERDDFKYDQGRDLRDGPVPRNARRGNPGFDDMRRGPGRRGASEFDDFKYGQGRGARGTSRGQSGLHDLRDDHGSGHMFGGPEFDEVKGTGSYVYRGSSDRF